MAESDSPLEEDLSFNLLKYKGFFTMAEQIKATKREKAGKGASRAIRLQGSIPAVIYGDKKAPEMISVEEKVMVAEMNKKGIWTRQYEILLDDGSKHLVLCQDIQKHPVSNRPIHADFLRISADSVLTMNIPLHFTGEDVCPGIKKGGVLNIVHRTVEVKCKANAIPTEFVVDLSEAEVGTSFDAFALQLPEGVVLTAQEDFTVATIVTAQEEVAEEGAAAAAAEAPAAETK